MSGTSAGTPPAAASPSFTNPDDRYFDGSPSIDSQNNEAGIVPSAAARIGDYSAKTVGDAYAALRQMLITADLDPAVLKGCGCRLFHPTTKGLPEPGTRQARE